MLVVDLLFDNGSSPQRRRMKHALAEAWGKARTMPFPLLLRKEVGRGVRLAQHSWRKLTVRFGPKEIPVRILEMALACPLEAVLARLVRGGGPRFFIDVADRERLVATLTRELPGAAAATIARADEVCDHVFDLLGSGKVALGARIDWHRDFKSGYRWPLRYYRDVRTINLHDDADVKVPWELSRFQHLLPLGQAYWHTREERYAREFCDQILDWIAHNPPMLGVNWTTGMEVAIRAVNWIWGYAFFRGSPSLTPEFAVRFLKALLQHGRFIAQNLEYGEAWEDGRLRRVTSNHYLADLVGLVYLGIMVPEFREGGGWLRRGLEEVLTELRHQVHSDGVDYEASTGYHRLVLECFLSVLLLCRRNGIEVPAWAWRRLEQMCEFVLHYTKPDGTAPLIGDADDGRLHPLGARPPHDHRHLLAVGAALFRRPEMKAAAGEPDEEVLWLLGLEGWAEWQRLPAAHEPPGSRAFPEGGVYIMRHGRAYLICDVGDAGIRGHGGHGHNDTLSFELLAGDKTFIVDPGAYIYSGDPVMRNLFRSTAYHNTVMVDGQEMGSLDQAALFRLGNEARGEVLRWESTDAYDLLDAQHRGYTRFDPPVVHRRCIYFDKMRGAFVVRDHLTGTGRHLLEWFFHLDAGIEVELVAPGRARTVCHGSNLLLAALNPNLSCRVMDGWVSKRYGVKEPARILRYVLEAALPRTVIFLLCPFEGPEPTDLQEVEAFAMREEFS